METGFVKTLKLLPESEKLIVDYLAILLYLVKSGGIFTYDGIGKTLESELALMVNSTPERIDRIIRYGKDYYIDQLSNISIRFNDAILLSYNVSSRSRRTKAMEKIKENCAKNAKLSTMQKNIATNSSQVNNLAFDFGSGFSLREKEHEKEVRKEK